MGATTVNLKLPYPALSDPANGPAAFQQLAEALDSGTVFAGAAPPTNPKAGVSLWWDSTNKLLKVWDGAVWVTVSPVGATKPIVRIRQAADQAFGTGVFTGANWTVDYQRNNSGILTYTGPGAIRVDRAGVYAVNLLGRANGGRFEWDILVGGNVYAAGAGATDFNVANLNLVEYFAAATSIGARFYGFNAGTLSGDTAALRHGMTVTYIGD